MRKNFTRNITVTYIEVAEIKMIEGQPSFDNAQKVKVLGKIKDKEKALKKAKQMLGNNNLFLLDVTLMNEEYSIKAEDFVKYATLVSTTDYQE